MLQYLPSWLKGPLFIAALVGQSLFWFIPFFLVSLIKVCIPQKKCRHLTTKTLVWLTENWVATNMLLMHLTQNTTWEIDIKAKLDRHQSYFVLCNHQSWVDIFVLQKILYKRIPFMKFFAKRELIWFPVCGYVWWMLDFPFMYRYSKDQLKSDPTKKGIDLETTKRVCEKFENVPTAFLSFVEGTRFTTDKHTYQNSPFHHLLKPKAGGFANTLTVLGKKLNSLLNVTIIYPDGQPNFYDFICGKIKRIKVCVEQLEIPAEFMNKDYTNDETYRTQVQAWLNQLWQEKDHKIQSTIVQNN